MSIGLYQSAASLNALERWQDAVAQNITSSQVVGFKRRTVQVGGERSGEILSAPGARPDRSEGTAAIFPQTRYAISFARGENQPTRRDLDIALGGDGFFHVRMQDGETAYTRVGQLQIRADRTLVTSQGLEILSDSDEPIQLLPEGGPPIIDPDGSVRQGDAVLGRLAVSRPADSARLVPLSAGLFLAGPGAGMETMDTPDILQAHLEASNVTPLREMVDLVNIGRAYEASQKLIQNRDKLLERTLETLT